MSALVIELVNGELAGRTMQNLTKDIRSARLEADKAKIGTQEWVDAHKKFDDAKGKLGDYQKQVANVTGASDSLKKSFGSVLGQIPGFGAISGVLNSAKTGVGGLTSGFGLLKGAIIATGIGALILLVISLVTWFTKTEVGGDLLAKGMQILGNIFRQLTESVSRLLSGDLIGFFRGVTTEMVQQVKAGNDLADLIDRLEEKESAFQVVQKAGMRDKAELLKMSKEEELSIQKRIAAIDKARIISKTLNDQEIANQREHLKIISGGTKEIGDALIKRLEASGLTMENAKEFFKKGNITQGDLDEANEALGKFLEIQASAFDEERELLVQRNKLTKRDKSADAAKTKEDEQVAKSQLEEIDKFNAEWNKKKDEQDAIQQERDKADEARQASHIKKQMASTVKYLQDRTNAFKKDADTQVKIEEAKQKMQAASLQTFNEGTSAIIGLLSADEAARKKNANTIKTFERGRVIVNGISEVSAIAKTFAELGPIGQILAAFKIAFSIARTAAGLKAIDSQKFARGGVLRGPSHTNGGIPIEAEGDEIILTRGVYRSSSLRAMASAVNVAGGGRSFAAGGPTNPFDASRGPVSSGKAASGSSDPFADIAGLRNDLQSYMARVDSWASNLKVSNNLQDTQKGLKTLNKLQSDASI